jgi:hypothetical protein
MKRHIRHKLAPLECRRITARRMVLPTLFGNGRNRMNKRSLSANNSELRRKAKDAKALLGATGTIHRVAAFAIVYKGYLSDDDWVVEAIDSQGDGGIYATVFAGPSAKERALEYAEEKYSGVEVRKQDQPPQK